MLSNILIPQMSCSISTSCTLPSSPGKQATRSHTQTDNYRGTKEPWKLKGEVKDSPGTQSSRQQQPSVLLSLFHYNGNTIKGNNQSELLLSMTDNKFKLLTCGLRRESYYILGNIPALQIYILCIFPFKLSLKA